jgi:hypothetical protein
MTLVALSYTVVCPVTAIEARWKGGLEGFRRSVPNRAYCCDGDLAGVGFMAADDAEAFVRKLDFHGLRHLEDDRCKDVAVVSHDHGLLHPCSWVQVGRCGPWRTVTLLGRGEEAPVGPAWWDPDAPPPTTQVSNEEFARCFRFLELREKVCSFEDTRSGTTKYITTLHGAALAGMLGLRLRHLTASTAPLADALESAATGVVDQPAVDALLSAADEAERMAEVCAPLASQALYLAARSSRIARAWGLAARRWEAFTRREPDFVAGWLELTWCRNMLGEHERALEAAEQAVAVEPDNHAALGNLAGTLHELGRDEEAFATLRRALSLAPDDPVNRSIARAIGVDPG